MRLLKSRYFWRGFGEGGIAAVILFAIALLIVCCLSGCNDKQKISDAAQMVNEQAVKIETGATEIRHEVAAIQPDLSRVDSLAEDVAARARSIRGSKGTGKIQGALPGVQDVPMFGGFFTYLKWGFFGLLIFVICIMLNQLGIMPIIRKIMAWVPALIPAREQLEAEADVAMLDEDDPMTPREVVARKRNCPVYNAAFQKKKREHELRKAQRTAVIVKP